MIDDSSRVAVVGAGHGGTATAALLRQHGFHGSVTLFGVERHAPYHRPPLSKSLPDSGPVTADPLRPERFYEEQAIDLRLGCHVQALDTESSTLHLGDGTEFPYDVAVLATGARPRRIGVPGAALAGVHTLRTLDDARTLGEGLAAGVRLAVVGGGYIGLEVAATARRVGVEVTVLEGAERVLGRSAGPALAAWLTDRHREQGTEVVLGAVVSRFLARADGRVGAVCLTDGRVVPADVVLVGVGAEPCDELAWRAGLQCDGGVIVDARARTSTAGVYAVGDMTRRPLPPYGGLFRLESIPSAAEQAKQAAADILGAPAPRPEVPWFWSDQFGLKLKIAGLPGLGAKAVVRGDPVASSFAVFHLDGSSRVVAVETVNAPREFMAGKKWIADRAVIDPDQLADAANSLRSPASRGET